MRASTSRWPTPPPIATPEPEAAPVLRIVEDPEAEAARLSQDLAVARSERDALAQALAEAQASLPEAASRGLEAAKKTQATIGETEGRLRSATGLVDALEKAAAPIFEAARRIYLARTRATFADRHQAILAERDAVDREVVEAVLALATAASRREACTAAALAIESEVRTAGLDSCGSAERGYHGSPVKAAVEAIPIPLRVLIGG